MAGFGQKFENNNKVSKKNIKISLDKVIKDAFLLHSQGNIKEAEKYYKYIIEQDYKDYRVFANYGLILVSKNRFKEAELFTRKAISLNPNLAMAHCNLGSILINSEESKEAELHTRKAISLNPNLAMAHCNLGNILKNLGKLEDAELSTRKAISLNPNLAMAYCNLGSILIDVGKLKDAKLSLLQAISLDPSCAMAYSNLGGVLIDLWELEDAEFYTRKAIKIKPQYAIAYCNLGNILKNLGKLEDAELSTRKAISLNPNLAMAHCNLGGILMDLGKLEEAKLSILQAINLDPNLCRSYVSISNLKYEKKDKSFLNTLFSTSILNKKNKKDQVDIYFARANILHKEKKYGESAKNLKLANNLKLSIYPSKPNFFIEKSKKLYIESNKLTKNKKKLINNMQSIFIVGMPRSGTTLVESILSMNTDVHDLGEINIFEKSFLEWKKKNQKKSLNEIYLRKINKNDKEYKISTNKWLYNYQYAGIIANEISNPKIIYCLRNPLDNILSIYKAHFARGNNYSSSLVDCAKIYLDHKQIMTNYQNEFRSKIYELNYDLLVSNPHAEIKSLVSWLRWEWNNSYLTPHLSKRSVSTRSNVQVRSPINSQSVGGWKNYKEMLKPAIEIISQLDEYQEFIET